MVFPERQASKLDSSVAVRSGWASVQGRQPAAGGWKRMWLLLNIDDLRIVDLEFSEPIVVQLHAISRLERVEHDEAPYCCLLGAGRLEFYVSYWSNDELQGWVCDIQSLIRADSTLVDGLDFSSLPAVSSMPLGDLSDCTEAEVCLQKALDVDRTPKPHSTPQPDEVKISPTDGAPEWLDDILNEYFDIPSKSPMSSTFPNTPLKLTRKRAFKRKSGDQSSAKPLHQPGRSISWAVNKHKLYQNLLSLVVVATSIDGLNQENCIVDVLRDLFKTIEALDSLSMLFSEPSWLRDLPWEMKKKEELELVTLLRAMSTSRSSYKGILGLRGARAQQFLDMAHEILQFPSLQRSEDKRFGIQVLKLMMRLSEICHKLPSSLFLEGVELSSRDATFWGSFSNVYRARYLGQTVALKRMRIFESDTDTAQSKLHRKFCREALVWQHLNHPNVCPFVGIDPDNFESLCMVSPWMENGTVLSYLALNGYKDVDAMLYGTAHGLAYLHSLDVIHGDLRGANILVDNEGRPRIADFGLAVLADMSTQTNSSTYPGSVRWMAPELLYPASQGLVKFQRTRASDVYSFACVCVELYTGLPPFSEIHNDATVALKVVACERPSRPAFNNTSPSKTRMPGAVWTLVQSCWCQAYDVRPSINTVVKYFRRDILKGRTRIL